MASKLLTPAAVALQAGVSTPGVLRAIREARLLARPVVGPEGRTSTWAITVKEAAKWIESRRQPKRQAEADAS